MSYFNTNSHVQISPYIFLCRIAISSTCQRSHWLLWVGGKSVAIRGYTRGMLLPLLMKMRMPFSSRLNGVREMVSINTNTWVFVRTKVTSGNTSYTKTIVEEGSIVIGPFATTLLFYFWWRFFTMTIAYTHNGKWTRWETAVYFNASMIMTFWVLFLVFLFFFIYIYYFTYLRIFSLIH